MVRWLARSAASLVGCVNLYRHPTWKCRLLGHTLKSSASAHLGSPYGQFPRPHDRFGFVPYTGVLSHHPLPDSDPKGTWASLFNPNLAHWSRGNSTLDPDHAGDGPYVGRGIYLCGYLDVPLDYPNDSDARIVRLAVTKFRVSGLALADSPPGYHPTLPEPKSERTIVIEPGGPRGSGTSEVWHEAEAMTKRFSDVQFDVLEWDPRGVNAPIPSAACFPHDADRGR